jgi:hypothetical protein
MMSKARLIAEMRRAARRLGRTSLAQNEFRRLAKVSLRVIDHHFDDWSEACAAAGLVHAHNYRIANEAIFAAMREAFLLTGGVRSTPRFRRRFRYDMTLLAKRWSDWAGALAAFRDWVLVAAPDFPYLAELERRIAKGPRAGSRRGAPLDRPAGTGRGWAGAGPPVGEPIAYRGIVYAPVNEMGVAVLFGAAAEALGFAIESVGVRFPDLLVRRRVAGGRWQLVRVELEYESLNFRAHRHDPRRCDLVVCWRHNWPECPAPVLELEKEIARLRRE